MARHVRSQGEVKLLVGTTPRSFDPSLPGVLGSPIKDRSTVTITPIMTDGGRGVVGRMTPSLLGPINLLGVLTVADNDFSTGAVELQLGETKLLPYFDYYPGVAVGATAITLAAAINRVPGYSATVIGAAVTIRCDLVSDDQVEFVARHYGTITNYTLVPTSGYFTVGAPVIGPPVISF